MRGELNEVERLRAANSYLKRENAELRQKMAEEITALKAINEKQSQEIETLKLQLEELRAIVFGRKKKPKDPPDSRPPAASSDNHHKPRDPASYRRPIPADKDVTGEEAKELPTLCCPDCQTVLVNVHWVIRYLEDILLPVKKIVKKLKIQIGFCPACKRQKQAVPVSAHAVTLGENTRKAVLYWTYVSRLSFQQIIDTARDLYGLKLTDGEIANILQTASFKLAKHYERLKEDIRGSPACHFDETTYREQGGQRYAWVMAPANSEQAAFIVGRNRGKGNATELAGNFQGVRITDCYPAYDNMPGGHQACWSHPLRYARDLANSAALSLEKNILCKEFYQQVQDVYAQVRAVIAEPFEPLQRTEAYERFRKQLDKLAEPPAAPAPKKLLALKTCFKNYAHEFLTCVLHENVPADNNKAERKLRHLVLKRKVSFGTKSAKGSQTFAINASVLLSWWWSDRTSFFASLSQALQGQ
jgi:transposase